MKPACKLELALMFFILLACFLFLKWMSGMEYGRGAWEIVKQRTNDHYHAKNYGFRVPYGNILAGYSNAESARMARDEFRHHYELVGKKLREETPKTRPTWETVK